MAITAVCIWVIIRIASRNGGANGDFYGTAIIAAEICLLAAGAV
ncbi:MAG: hypothetical protein LIP28_02340 [Deltaproteobacteria bacterium]|nr:hypothetical protein [Deltaproteobacteria bacterium]